MVRLNSVYNSTVLCKLAHDAVESISMTYNDFDLLVSTTLINMI